MEFRDGKIEGEIEVDEDGEAFSMGWREGEEERARVEVLGMQKALDSEVVSFVEIELNILNLCGTSQEV